MTELTTQETANLPSTISAGALMMSPTHMETLYKFANTMAESTVSVPTHLVGKVADCLAIAMQAMQWGMNPFAVAQKTHLVNGRLGYEAQLVVAVLRSTSAIRGSFKYEFTAAQGEDVQCRVGAVLAGETEITWGEWLKLGFVTTRNSPLWKTNPKQQLGYLQVKNWARLYAPEAILGVYTPDEMVTIDGDTGQPLNTPAASLMPQRRANADATDAQIVERSTDTPADSAIGGTTARTHAETPAAPPPPAPAATPAPAPAPRTESQAEPTEGSREETGELAGDGHRRNLENKAKAAGVDIAATYERLGFRPSTLTLTQFETMKRELTK